MASPSIIGNYRIETLLGRGGMGVVYRGRHLKLPREVAIKSISASSNRDLRRLRSRFEKEAFIQSQLDHPGIVKVYDYIVGEQTYYIVMELVEGQSLEQLLARAASPLAVERALNLFEQILAAIAYAQDFVYEDQDGSSHQGLIHRDLKPANILITPDDRVKITDFGIVKLVGSEKTNTDGNYGSPEYVSPEQAQGLPLDPRSDIYSLGIILYEMLTGQPPFHDQGGKLSQLDIVRAHVESQPRAPSELNPLITPALENLIMRAIEKQPENRFETANIFLGELNRFRGHETGEIQTDMNATPRPRIKVGTQELVGPTVADSGRGSYITQSIKETNCSACGTATQDGDMHCRQCGQALVGSATVQLTRQEAQEWQRKRSFGLWLASAAVIIPLAAVLIYFATRADAPESTSSAAQVSPTAARTPAPLSALLEIKPARVAVDSSYDGYTEAPLTDGELDVRRISRMKYNEGNWASDETPQPHWIELSFDEPTRLAAVYIYWGFDRNRFMPSRQVELQTMNGGGQWQTISLIGPDKDHDRMAFDLAPVETSRIRIFQPARQGPPNRPFIMWVREVKVFALKEEN